MLGKIKKIRKRDGKIAKFKLQKIAAAIYKATEAVGKPDFDLSKRLSQIVARRLRKELKLGQIPRVEQVQDMVEQVLIAQGQARIAKAYIIYRRKRTQIREEKRKILNKAQIDQVDKTFDVNALRVLCSRYLRKDASGQIIESPKQLFERVAVHVALPSLLYDSRVFQKRAAPEHQFEQFNPDEFAGKLKLGRFSLNRFHLRALKRLYDRFNKNKQMKLAWGKFLGLLQKGEFSKYQTEVKQYYKLMAERKFMPNTPTLVNFGNYLGMGSACFVLDIKDSMESIMDALKQASLIFKAGGGVGYNFSNLRPEGDFVKTTGGVSSGPITFMSLFDKMTDVVKQGGCVSNNTVIRSDKGIMEIGNLLNSRNFGENWTHHFVYDGREHSQAILAQNNGFAKVYRVETELGNYLDSTWNHRVASVDKEGNFVWKRVIDLKTGDWVICVLGGAVGGDVKLEPMGPLHSNANKISIPKVLNRQLAELLGLYMAVGCWNNGKMLMSIDKENPDLEKRVRFLMDRVFNLRVEEERDKSGFKGLVFFSKALEEYFSKREWKKTSSRFGISNPETAFIPKDIFLSKPKIAAAFLRGLFEGGRGTYLDGYPIFSSTSRRLIFDMQQLLLSLGMIAEVRGTKKHEEKSHWGQKEVWWLRILTIRSVKKFKEKIGFLPKGRKEKFGRYQREKVIETSDLIPNISKLLERHRQQIPLSKENQGHFRIDYEKAVGHYLREERTLTRKTLKKLMRRFGFLGQDTRLKKLINDKYFFVRITNVKKIGEALPTMEIEVPASGSYVANGILTHNIRRGASMGILDSDHPDIEKFVVAKRGNQALRNFNISVFVKGDFWDYYKQGKPYPLINPRNGQAVKHIDPHNLFDLIVYQAWESAEPGLVFGETINKYNPFLESLGPIRATNPCVSSDTWIMTSGGPKQVRDLIGKKTEVVVNGKKWSNSGQGFFNTGTKLLLKLKTKEGFELSLTSNHLVKKVTKFTRYKIDSEWEKAENLKSGDKIILNAHKNLEWEGRYNKEEGYLIGLLIGDGCVGANETILESRGLSEGEKKVRVIVEKYTKSFPHRSDFQGWQYEPMFRLTLARLRRLAEELGVERNKQITPQIEKASSDFYKGFLKGLFDAAGSVQGTQEKGVSVRLAQSDPGRLKKVQRMLLRLGIVSKIYYDRRNKKKGRLPDGKGGYKMHPVKPRHELVVANTNLVSFYRRVGFENTDKLNKLEKRLNSYKRSLNKERFVATVKELVPMGKEKVYDIQVPGINAFDANGLYVHNCGEVPLYPSESCNLGSINVWAFAKAKLNNGRKKEVGFDWKEFGKTIHLATRFLDNVVEVNKYPLPQIEKATLSTRKIGLGVMGLGDLLYDLGIPYNSAEGFGFMEKLMEFLNYHSKVTSIELAKERGPFLYYKKSFYPQGKLPFAGRVGQLPFMSEQAGQDLNLDWEQVKQGIKQYGIRNAHTTTNAPTGSVSMIAGCSSGIEPVFSLVYEKKVTVGSFYYVNSVFEKVMLREGLFDEDLIKEVSEREGSIQDINYIPAWLKKIFVTAMDIKAEDHIKALAVLQRWTDSSISKTINFPEEASIEDMKKAFLLAHDLGCKDLTVFRNKSIKGVLRAGKRAEEKKEKEKAKVKAKEGGEKLVSLRDVKAKGPSIYREAGVKEEQESRRSVRKRGLELCPQCQAPLVNEEGCKRCPVCGWGACST